MITISINNSKGPSRATRVQPSPERGIASQLTFLTKGRRQAVKGWLSRYRAGRDTIRRRIASTGYCNSSRDRTGRRMLLLSRRNLNKVRRRICTCTATNASSCHPLSRSPASRRTKRSAPLESREEVWPMRQCRASCTLQQLVRHRV